MPNMGCTSRMNRQRSVTISFSESTPTPMALTLVAAACGLLVPTPVVQQYAVQQSVVQAAPVAAQSLLFPTTQNLAEYITSFDDELEKAAAAQKAQDALIDARVRRARNSPDASRSPARTVLLTTLLAAPA